MKAWHLLTVVRKRIVADNESQAFTGNQIWLTLGLPHLQWVTTCGPIIEVKQL